MRGIRVVIKCLIVLGSVALGLGAERKVDAGPIARALAADALLLTAVSAYTTLTVMEGTQSPHYQERIATLTRSLKIHVIAGERLILQAMILVVARDPAMLLNARQVATDLNLDPQKIRVSPMQGGTQGGSAAIGRTVVVNGITYEVTETDPLQVYYHYSLKSFWLSKNPLTSKSNKLFGSGLRANAYATDWGNLTGSQAHNGLALDIVPDVVHEVRPPAGTVVYYNSRAIPQPNGTTGGLPEYIFPFGTPPGSVGPPRDILP